MFLLLILVNPLPFHMVCHLCHDIT
jgi:hypothetical protein